MSGWRVEYELIDKALNPRQVVKRSSNFRQAKWVRGEVAERQVLFFGIERTVPAGEKTRYKELMRSTYVHRETLDTLDTEVAKQVEHILGKGRRFQFGEGWHSSAKAGRFGPPSPRWPQEAASRGDAFPTASVMRIRLCDSLCARLKTRSRSPRGSSPRGRGPVSWQAPSSQTCWPHEPVAPRRGPPARRGGRLVGARAWPSARAGAGVDRAGGGGGGKGVHRGALPRRSSLARRREGGRRLSVAAGHSRPGAVRGPSWCRVRPRLAPGPWRRARAPWMRRRAAHGLRPSRGQPTVGGLPCSWGPMGGGARCARRAAKARARREGPRAQWACGRAGASIARGPGRSSSGGVSAVGGRSGRPSLPAGRVGGSPPCARASGARPRSSGSGRGPAGGGVCWPSAWRPMPRASWTAPTRCRPGGRGPLPGAMDAPPRRAGGVAGPDTVCGLAPLPGSWPLWRTPETSRGGPRRHGTPGGRSRRIWSATGSTSTRPNIRISACPWAGGGWRVPAHGSSHHASKGAGYGGVRTGSTLSCPSGAPGAMHALRPCAFCPRPRTRKCARARWAGSHVPSSRTRHPY